MAHRGFRVEVEALSCLIIKKGTTFLAWLGEDIQWSRRCLYSHLTCTPNWVNSGFPSGRTKWHVMTYGTALCLNAVDSRLFPLTGNKIPLYLEYREKRWQWGHRILADCVPHTFVANSDGMWHPREQTALRSGSSRWTLLLLHEIWGVHWPWGKNWGSNCLAARTTIKVRIPSVVTVKCGFQYAHIYWSSVLLEYPCSQDAFISGPLSCLTDPYKKCLPCFFHLKVILTSNKNKDWL